MQSTIEVYVSGKVQGVFFRQQTKEKALELNIVGEVQNLPDGRVFIIASGTDTQLDKLTEWCRQGPPRAIVNDVSIEKVPFRNFDTFIINRN